MHLILRGHLYFEFLINELLSKKLGSEANLEDIRMSFFQKVKLLKALTLIDDPMTDFLLTFNKIRNSYAHKLLFELTFDDVFNLVNLAVNAGVEFSDETIHNDYAKSKIWYGIEGTLMEVIINVFSALIYSNEILFSNDEISQLIG